MKKKALALLLPLLALAACRSGGTAVKPKQDSNRFYIDFGRGVAALERSDYGAAIHSLSLALAEQPGSARTLNLRGVAYLMSGRINEAKADFESAIALDPAYGTAYQNLGGVLAKEMRLDEAEAVLRRALERSPASASAHFSLGSVLIFQGRSEEAMAVMRRGLELDPDYFAAEQRFTTGPGLQDANRPELFFSYARLFAASGDVGKTAEYLRLAKKAGFKDWQRIRTLGDFDPVRADPALEEFIR